MEEKPIPKGTEFSGWDLMSEMSILMNGAYGDQDRRREQEEQEAKKSAEIRARILAR